MNREHLSKPFAQIVNKAKKLNIRLGDNLERRFPITYKALWGNADKSKRSSLIKMTAGATAFSASSILPSAVEAAISSKEKNGSAETVVQLFNREKIVVNGPGRFAAQIQASLGDLSLQTIPSGGGGNEETRTIFEKFDGGKPLFQNGVMVIKNADEGTAYFPQSAQDFAYRYAPRVWHESGESNFIILCAQYEKVDNGISSSNPNLADRRLSFALSYKGRGPGSIDDVLATNGAVETAIIPITIKEISQSIANGPALLEAMRLIITEKIVHEYINQLVEESGPAALIDQEQSSEANLVLKRLSPEQINEIGNRISEIISSLDRIPVLCYNSRDGLIAVLPDPEILPEAGAELISSLAEKVENLTIQGGEAVITLLANIHASYELRDNHTRGGITPKHGMPNDAPW